MGLYFEPTNKTVKGYLGLYRGNDIINYTKNTKELSTLINWFFINSRNGQDVVYNEKNKKMIVKLYQALKQKKWEGDLVCFTDTAPVEMPDFTFLGYDICADSMYYSPIGDGFLTEYNKYPRFYTDMSFGRYSEYRNNVNANWLFSSYEMAIEFSNYCNYINQKDLYCIESEDHWRPFAICRYNLYCRYNL